MDRFAVYPIRGKDINTDTLGCRLAHDGDWASYTEAQAEIDALTAEIERLRALFPKCYMSAWQDAFGLTEDYVRRRELARQDAAEWLTDHDRLEPNEHAA